MGWGEGVVYEHLVPEFELVEVPELLGVVGAVEVFLYEALDFGVVEVAAVSGGGGEQGVCQMLLERAAEPLGYWYFEPPFFAAADSGWKQLTGDFTDDPFRCAVANLQCVWKIGEGVVDDGGIEKRTPELEGVGHGNAVAAEEEIGG